MSKKLKEAIDGLDEVKKKQVLAEIRSVKINYIIAIVGVIGAAISFMIVQQDKIKSLFERNPRISITTEENFIKRNAVVEVKDINGNLKINTAFKDIDN